MELLERFASSLHASDPGSLIVGDYFKWQGRHLATSFIPSDDDDIDLRTYLLDLYTHGADQTMLEEQVAALKRFYQWLHAEGCIARSPFDDYNYLNPLLDSEQVAPRQQALASDPKFILLGTLLQLLNWIVYGFMGLLVIEALFSWINPHAPLAPFIAALMQVGRMAGARARRQYP